jgi:hypothetical protein
MGFYSKVRNLDPKAACLKRREEEKTEDINSSGSVSLNLAPQQTSANMMNSQMGNENINTLGVGMSNQMNNMGTHPTSSSSIDNWWLTVSFFLFLKCS